MAKASSVDVYMRLRNARQFQRQVGESAASLEAMGLKGAGALARFSAQADKLKSFGSTMTRNVTLPILGIGYVTGKAAIDFDKSMRNVNSIAQLSEGQFGKLEDQVLDMAKTTAQMPTTLADGLYDLVSSGFDASESMKILHSSALAATAGLTTTDVSTKAVAAVLNAYHLSADKAGLVSDQLFQTVNLGVVSFQELATTIGDVLPFASSLGVGLDQVGASISTMTKAGISPAETMTRIKNVMVTMLKPGEALSKAIKGLGYESGEAMIKALGFQGTLDALVGSTDGTKEQVAKLFPNIRALGGVLALTGKNTKGAHKDLKNFADVNGATARALSQQSKSISYQWNKLKANATAVAIKAAPPFLDALQSILGKVKDAVEWFAKLDPKTQTLIAKFLILAAAIGPAAKILGYFASGVGRFLVVLNSLATGIGSVIKFFQIWFTAMAAGQGVLGGLDIALAAFGISLKAVMVTTGIGAVIAAIILLNQKFHFLGPLVAGIKNVAAAVWNWIKDHWQLLADILFGPFGLAAGWIITHWGQVKQFFSDFAGKIKDIFDGPITWIADKIKWLFDQLAKVKDSLDALNPFAGGPARLGDSSANGGTNLAAPSHHGPQAPHTTGPTGGGGGGASKVSRPLRKFGSSGISLGLAGAGGHQTVIPLKLELDGEVIAQKTFTHVEDAEARR